MFRLVKLFGQLRLDGLLGSFVSYKLVKLGGPIKLAIKIGQSFLLCHLNQISLFG